MKIVVGQAYTRNIFPFNIGALLIKYVQKTNYSHYYTCVSGMFIDSSTRGVIASSIQAFSDNYFWEKYPRWEVTLDCDEKILSKWINKQMGKKYAYIQNIGLGLMVLCGFEENIFTNGLKKFNCTEFVVKMIKEFAPTDLAHIDSEDYDLIKTTTLLQMLEEEGIARRIA